MIVDADPMTAFAVTRAMDFMVLALRVTDGDFRDWDAIDSWARQIAAELSSLHPVTGR